MNEQNIVRQARSALAKTIVEEYYNDPSLTPEEQMEETVIYLDTLLSDTYKNKCKCKCDACKRKL